MASGDTLAIFTAAHGVPPDASYGTLDRSSEHTVVDLAEGETIYFEGVMPQHYAGGGVTIDCVYAMSTATSGNIEIQTSFENIADGAKLTTSAAAGTQSSGDVAVPGATVTTDTATITHTDGAQMDSVTAGTPFRLAVLRDPPSTGAASGDLELIRVHIKET